VEHATGGQIKLRHAARLQQADHRVDTFQKEDRAVRFDLAFMWFPNDRNIPSGTALHVGFTFDSSRGTIEVCKRTAPGAGHKFTSETHAQTACRSNLVKPAVGRGAAGSSRASVRPTVSMRTTIEGGSR